MKKVVRLTESELIKIVKRIIKESECCNNTFDELKDKVNTVKQWTLKKTDGVWSLSNGNFCTKDITLYGVRAPIEDSGQTDIFQRYDQVENMIYFETFNVGPSK